MYHPNKYAGNSWTRVTFASICAILLSCQTPIAFIPKYSPFSQKYSVNIIRQNEILHSGTGVLARNEIIKAKSAKSDIPIVPDSEIKTDDDSMTVFTARATLLFVSALYGTNFGCVKILDEALEPSFAATLRFSLAAIVFLPYLISLGSAKKKLVLGGIEVGLYAGVGYWAQASALLTTKASTAAFVCSLAVLVVPVLDMMSGKRSSSRAWYMTFIPALLATAGVACLELGGSEAPGVGDLFAFLQPIFFG